MQQMRLRPLRRLPLAFGWLTKRGDAATAGWIKPVTYIGLVAVAAAVSRLPLP